VWFLGILVPVLYQVGLEISMGATSGHAKSYGSTVSHFYEMPIVLWLYLLAMALVGAALIHRGIYGPILSDWELPPGIKK